MTENGKRPPPIGRTMRPLVAAMLLVLLAGCTVPAARLEPASLPALATGAPTTLDLPGRLDDAHPEARLPIHVPEGASGVRFDLTWRSAQDGTAPEVSLVDAHGAPAATGGHATAGGGPRPEGGYGGITSGVWTAPPGDYLLRVAFPLGFPAGAAYEVVLHAEPAA